jgi:hypothetical protein
MFRAWFLAVAAGLTLASTGLAQNFQWRAGQVLTYHVEETTAKVEVVEGKKIETATKMNNDKRWQVLAVDAAGVATLQLSLTALHFELTTPTGEVLRYDSREKDKSDPQMAEQLGRFVNTPLAVLRVDAKGRLVEVKESKDGRPSRYETQLPFLITLPDEALRAGAAWQRAYAIALDPPEGTGDKYEAVQSYVCKGVQGATATVGVVTTLKTLPKAAADQEPLLQWQPEGEVVFDVQSGRLSSARLSVNKELKDQQGEGSSYRFQSNYVEQLTGSN